MVKKEYTCTEEILMARRQKYIDAFRTMWTLAGLQREKIEQKCLEMEASLPLVVFDGEEDPEWYN